MPWLSSRPPGRSSPNSRPAYPGSRAAPTCSTMPIELIASNGPSRTSPVVLDPEGDPAGQPGPAGGGSGVGRLRFGQGDPDCVDAVPGRGVQRHPAPPATHVQEPPRRAQPALAGDELVFRGPRLVQVRPGRSHSAQE